MNHLSSANFKRITFGTGPLAAEKLNALQGNTEYLFDRMLRGYVATDGLNRDTNIRIQGFICQATTSLNNVSRYSNVYWPKPFAAGCRPIMTTGHFFTEALIHSVGFRHIAGGVFPDNAGFRIEVFAPTTEYGDEWRGTHWYSVMGLGW